MDESEKMRYILKALPSNYSYIGDFIDVIPEEQRTVDYVKSKIKEKNMNRNQNERKNNVSTFTTRTREQCFCSIFAISFACLGNGKWLDRACVQIIYLL